MVVVMAPNRWQSAMSGLGFSSGGGSAPPEWTGGGGASSNNNRGGAFRATVDRAIGAVNPAHSAADALCPSLTYRQRLQGTLACFVIGLTFSIVGTILWWTGHVASFALLYTLGNLTSICGTGFLIGPKKQVKNMCKARRAIATCIYFGAMVLTLAAALKSWPAVTILLLVLLQWCAMVWYIASYIPYGQKMLSKCLGSMAGV